MFNKLYLKYQFFNKIFLNNFLFYNFNFVKTKSELFFYNFNFIFTTLSNKKFFYFSSKNPIVCNSPLTIAWFINKPQTCTTIVPFFMNLQNSYFPYQDLNIKPFNLESVFDVFFDSFLKNSIEIKRIITLLFFYKLILKVK